MSVSVDLDVRWRPYPNPSADPRMPVAIWYIQGGVVGDATGGSAEINIILNPAGTVRSGQSWSIEVSLPTVALDSADRPFRCNALNLDVLGPGLTNPIQKAFFQLCSFTNAAVSAPRSGVAVGDIHPRIYLGTQGAATAPAQLQGMFSNTNLLTFGWYASGYVWGPAALKDGHLKPRDSLLS